MNRIKKHEKWYWLAVIAVELVLFYSSSMTYKQQTSVPFLEQHLGSNNKPFYHFLSGIRFNYGGKIQSIQNDGYFRFVEFFIRKGAHFGTYFILGLFLSLALYNYFQTHKILSFFIPWTVSTGLAAFDEFHQGLTGGRTPSVDDVMLDSMGALLASLLILLFVYIVNKLKKIPV
ncbi:VanZ family protein [Companilactobacillus keshanensis]|uniref:VanZ family protein n=1 Tax=Companilactobacillus keshanensis TaxID=2486003 RepID=A0ABW4BT84_9LACO|nr:VanZ family protein [Companilactobacillus keshanensis]